MEHLVSFESALGAVRIGKSIQRAGWNGKGLIVKLQVPDENSKMSLPYLYIEYPESIFDPTGEIIPAKRCPWLASQTDILTMDWRVID